MGVHETRSDGMRNELCEERKGRYDHRCKVGEALQP